MDKRTVRIAPCFPQSQESDKRHHIMKSLQRFLHIFSVTFMNTPYELLAIFFYVTV